jgi:hypothetical protein
MRQAILTISTLRKMPMFKPDKKTTLLAIIPYDVFKTLEIKLQLDLTHCKGIVEKESDRDIWFGFVGKRPMRFTYRQTDQKTTWATCNLETVKTKLKEL